MPFTASQRMSTIFTYFAEELAMDEVVDWYRA
jgi:hypothetical protein